MSPFNNVSGFCELQNKTVELLMINLKKAKGKDSAMTPVRCQNSAQCPRGVFCRFVNPLTTRLPVVFDKEPGLSQPESA